MRPLVAIAILVFTVGTGLLRPTIRGFRVHPYMAALAGGGAAVATGLVSLPDALDKILFLVKPLVTLVALMVLTTVAAHAGLFRLFAFRMARAARGDGRKLFAYLFVAGTVTGALFTNDAAVLIFTPLVLELTQDIRDASWSRLSRRAYCFTSLYVANLVGPLVISNPINLVVADLFDVGFTEYAAWMLLPALASVAVTYLGLRWFFRDDLPATFRVPMEEPTIVGGARFGSITAAVLGLTLVGFFSERATGVEVVYVAVLGAAVLVGLYRGVARGAVTPVFRSVGWNVVAFVIGIFIVAAAVRNAGVTEPIGDAILAAGEATGSETVATFVTALLAACSSAVLNNHPVAQMMAFTIKDLPYTGSEQLMKVLAALIGGDLGPKMLPLGSLAALLWFKLLRNHGVEASFARYIKIGVPVTLLAVVCSTLVLVAEHSVYLAWIAAG